MQAGDAGLVPSGAAVRRRPHTLARDRVLRVVFRRWIRGPSPNHSPLSHLRISILLICLSGNEFNEILDAT